MGDKLKCFTAYDVRGEVGKDFDVNIAQRIAKSIVEHFGAKKVVISIDCRESSVEIKNAIVQGLHYMGSDILDIGMAGTEEMYWAVSDSRACVGIQVTASHNPLNYNGLKIVKARSRPLDYDKDLFPIKLCAEKDGWPAKKRCGTIARIGKKARQSYLKKILSFMNIAQVRPLKILANCGSGTAGPTVNMLISELKKLNLPLEFEVINDKPDPHFKNGSPDPLTPESVRQTSAAVKRVGADFGISFDGDFDRCIFFDETGKLIQNEYIIGILTEVMLSKFPGGGIIQDVRSIWSVKNSASKYSGKIFLSKAGHTHMKEALRLHDAIYGGEISAHHYFRDFVRCDSGMIPWLLMIQYLSEAQIAMSEIINFRRDKNPSSGEINFVVENKQAAMRDVENVFAGGSEKTHFFDGLTCEYQDWRFNLRKSHTENFLRLNVESKQNLELLREKVKALEDVISRH